MSASIIKQINDRIQEDGGIDEAIELNLSDLKLTSITPQIRKALEKAKNVEVVLLSDNQLTDIDNLPDWKLSAIDLSNNKLTDNVFVKLAKYADLAQINIADNQISTFDGLRPLFALKDLIEIDLSDNPVTELPGYREHLFAQIKTLDILDHCDADGNQVPEEEIEGAGEEGDELDSDEEEFDEDESDYEEEESESLPKKKKK